MAARDSDIRKGRNGGGVAPKSYTYKLTTPRLIVVGGCIALSYNLNEEEFKRNNVCLSVSDWLAVYPCCLFVSRLTTRQGRVNKPSPGVYIFGHFHFFFFFRIFEAVRYVKMQRDTARCS